MILMNVTCNLVLNFMARTMPPLGVTCFPDGKPVSPRSPVHFIVT